MYYVLRISMYYVLGEIMSKLVNKLIENSKSNMYPFHMPGHKRNLKNLKLFHKIDFPYAIDITEIKGFDDMHHPEEILKEFVEGIANLYGCKKSFMLVNGSTGGILSAITSVTEIGDEILISRNCHKSIYNSVILRNLKPSYVYPQYNSKTGICTSILPNDVEKQLEINRNIKAVVIVSPTYEGVVSNIKEIARICHKYNVPLIVDEAHGAHFLYGDSFPKSAVQCGADIVIQSLHKTLPALTQTGLLHVQGDLVDIEKVQENLALYQTSSPSYVFMSSIELCIEFLNSKEGNEYMGRYEVQLQSIRQKIKQLNNIWLLDKDETMFDYDCSKLVFGIKNQYGKGTYIGEYLREQHQIEVEMCSYNYGIAMTSLMDSESGFLRLYDGLKQLNDRLEQCHNKEYNETDELLGITPLKQVYTPYECRRWKKKRVSINNCEGKISGEMAYIYPPGIPFIVYGEKLTKEVIDCVKKYKQAGFHIHGLKDDTANFIDIVEENENM